VGARDASKSREALKKGDCPLASMRVERASERRECKGWEKEKRDETSKKVE